MTLSRIFLFALLLITTTAVADDYGFPELDGFASTVIGTPTELQPDLSIRGRPEKTFAIDTRASIAFRYYELGNVSEYLWVRQLYFELREFRIKR